MTTILESVRAFMAEEFKGGAANISDLISACQEAESRKDLASIVEDINNQKLKEDATTLLQNGFDEGVEPELISLKLVKLLEEHKGSRNDANLTDINQQRKARSKKLESYERNLLGEYYDSGWREVDSKPVKDWDDFWTDYTWYVDATGHHVFIFGDKDIYGPEDTPDHEVDGDYSEAEEWFLSYEGAFGDEDDYEECFSLDKVAEAMAWEDDDYDDDDWGTPRLSSSTPADRAGEWSTLGYKERLKYSDGYNYADLEESIKKPSKKLNEEAKKLVNKNNGLEYTHRTDTFNGAEYDYYRLGYISRVNCGATVYYKHARGNNGYKYYVKQYHPYDDAEYSWAHSDDGRDWKVVYRGRVVDKLTTRLEDFVTVAENIINRDKGVEPKMMYN